MTKAATRKSTRQFKKEEEETKSEAWRGICSSRCYMAKTDPKRCKCKCHGENHGKKHTDQQEENKITAYYPKEETT